MTNTDQGSNAPRPATKDDIPRAVEFLIQCLIRWACFGLAGFLGLVAILTGAIVGPWWVVALAALFAFASFACGTALRPQGRFRFDRVGPSIVVPARRGQPRE